MKKLKLFFEKNKAKLLFLILILIISICLGVAYSFSFLTDEIKAKIATNIKDNLNINSYAFFPCLISSIRLFLFIYLCGLLPKTRWASFLVLLIKGYSIGITFVLLTSSIGTYGFLINLIYILVDITILLPALFWFILQCFRVYENKRHIRRLWTTKFAVCFVFCIMLAFINAYLIPVFVVKLVSYT